MLIWSLCAERNRVIALGEPFKSPIGFISIRAIWRKKLYCEQESFIWKPWWREMFKLPPLLGWRELPAPTCYTHIYTILPKSSSIIAMMSLGLLTFSWLRTNLWEGHIVPSHEIVPFLFFSDKTTLRENLQVRKLSIWFWYMSMNKKLLFPVEEVSLKKQNLAVSDRSLCWTQNFK